MPRSACFPLHQLLLPHQSYPGHQFLRASRNCLQPTSERRQGLNQSLSRRSPLPRRPVRSVSVSPLVLDHRQVLCLYLQQRIVSASAPPLSKFRLPRQKRQPRSAINHLLFPPNTPPPLSTLHLGRLCLALSSRSRHESPGLPPIEVPDLGDPNMQRFFRQIVEHLSVMQPRSSIAASDDGRSGVSSMGSGSERMSPQHSRGGTSGYSSQVEGDGDAGRFADADEEYYATDVDGYASSTGGGSIRSAGTSGVPRNMAQTGARPNRHSYHQPPVPPPKNETIRGGTVFGRLQSSRSPPLRGSSYGSPYHQNLHTHPLQSRALSNQQSSHSPPLSAPPIPDRHRSYPVRGVYSSDKENSVPPRATLSAGVVPRPSLKNAHGGGAGTIGRQKSNGKKHVQIVLPGEEARLKQKKSFSSE